MGPALRGWSLPAAGSRTACEDILQRPSAILQGVSSSCLFLCHHCHLDQVAIHCCPVKCYGNLHTILVLALPHLSKEYLLYRCEFLCTFGLYLFSLFCNCCYITLTMQLGRNMFLVLQHSMDSSCIAIIILWQKAFLES